MAVYSMVAYERVFFSHIYRGNYEMNYFWYNLAKLSLLKLKKWYDIWIQHPKVWFVLKEETANQRQRRRKTPIY